MFVVFVSTGVTVNSHIILFFCRHFKNPVRKHSEFSVQDCADPARLLTNQIACFTVVII